MAEATTTKKPPIVDPSPTAPPIEAGSEELILPPAPASPPEVLALKPNKAVDATAGPHAQISSTTYVHMTRPDGSDFLSPLSNVEQYERKGFTKGATEEIEDIGAYWAAKASA
jgi:hypothetical protein